MPTAEVQGPVLRAPVPVLRIFDEAAAQAFYIDFLGFSEDWSHRFADDLPLYRQISRGGCVLHLSGHHGDACPGSTLRIEACGLESWCVALNARQYRHARPGIADTDWGTREMRIADPFGNTLVFFEEQSR
jgi:uncharacterized glyoxalase superfamily protein PhnB